MRVLGPGDRSTAGSQTPGMVREEAFADERSWVGLARTEPGQVSGWHHHGEYETFFYCVSGRVRVEHGSGGRDVMEAGAGDFARIPRGIVHRESNPGSEESVVVVFRVGNGRIWSTSRAPMPDVGVAARRWVDSWMRAWPARDTEPIAALYADSASYRALAFREPGLGLAGVRRYLTETFADEGEIECRFGDPIVAGNRAAVEWWASWVEGGEPLTLAGVTVLRFDAEGKIVDHRDYWNQADRRQPPYEGW
ncbi:MAG: nuclear transport factor 2 family protein [Actinomycetota bacterium]